METYSSGPPGHENAGILSFVNFPGMNLDCSSLLRLQLMNQMDKSLVWHTKQCNTI